MRGRESKRAVRGARTRPTSEGVIRPPRPALPASAGGDRVFVPQGYEPAYDYPLIVWLPDASRPFDLGRTMCRTSLRNYVAVEPASGADPEARAWRAIERVRDRHSVHPRRIYLVGLGSGGSDAFRIACRAPEAFGGVASLGGPFPLDEGLFAAAGRVRRLPMLLCMRHDLVAAAPSPVDRALRLFHAAGATLSLRLYPGRDDVSRAMLADVNRWVMEDVCGAAASEPARCAP
ncbi:MAG: alpha/beta hydrolase [Planctomycetaceae bacterium]